LIPGFVAFRRRRASQMERLQAIAAFFHVMMVGIVTMPLEIKTFGMRATNRPNVSASRSPLIAAFCDRGGVVDESIHQALQVFLLLALANPRGRCGKPGDRLKPEPHEAESYRKLSSSRRSSFLLA
jgi:hypothetical protein